jgi:phosphoribosyl 1,2-cyclic phosphodiesterase
VQQLVFAGLRAQRSDMVRARLMRTVAVLSFCFAGAGLGACRWITTGSPAPLHPTPADSVRTVGDCVRTCTDSVDIVAMGVAGFLIVPWRDSTRLVLTPPMFTNPTVWWMTFGDLLFGTHPDTALISRRLASMPAANRERLSRVHAVLVGHGHYDHLLDLPPMLAGMPHAVVYGSETVRQLLAPVHTLSASRRVAVDSLAGTDHGHPGRSFPVGQAVRVRAIAWAHAPNVGSLTIAPGHQRTPRQSLPRTVHGWKMGTTYAYAVDIVGADDGVAYRIVFHDAAAGPAVQRRAAEVIATMPAAKHTALIMTAANFDQPPLYPDILLAHLAPRHVLLGHWDDFFRSSEARERVVRGIRSRELVQRITPFVGDNWSAPRAGAVTRLRW